MNIFELIIVRIASRIVFRWVVRMYEMRVTIFC